MATQLLRSDIGAGMGTPAIPGYPTREYSAAFGASLTLKRLQAVARKTSDGKMYPLNLAAADGTQIFGGFTRYAMATDANGICYFLGGTSPTAQADVFTTGYPVAPIFTSGVFDPTELVTAATGTAAAEVDTITPTNPTTGDVYSVSTPGGDAVSFTVGATQTAAATVAGLQAAWAANPVTAALATATGSGTLILTAKTPGQPLNLTASAIGTGTVALVVTTAAVDAVRAEVDTFTPANPTTGDVYTITITYPNLTTHAISATVGATQTATGITTLLKAAWAADPVAAAYATASGTATFILTSATPGSAMSVAGSVVGTGTISKVVTTPTLGRNIADILPGCPGARVIQPTGYWHLP